MTWTVDPDGAVGGGTENAQSLLEFQGGATLIPTVTDPDGIVTATEDIAWSWYRSSSRTSMGTQIEDDQGAAVVTATYTVSDTSDSDDVGKYLWAVAEYEDNRRANQIAKFVSPHKVRAAVEDNQGPKFAPLAHTRRVQEGAAGLAVGGPVTATDADNHVLKLRVRARDE